MACSRGLHVSVSDITTQRRRLRLERHCSTSARLTSTRQCRDTAGSALTGRHQPAAREDSHLFGLSRVRLHLLSAWFQRGTGD